MFAKLTGKVDSIDGNTLIVDVSGVGYLVSASAKTIAQLDAGSVASFYIETHVREDAIQLFGFANREERDAFRMLYNVQGVGGRHALAILSVLSPDQLTQSILAQDKTSLTVADGIGPKLAVRILTELKDKVAGIALAPTSITAKSADKKSKDPQQSLLQDAVSALVNLGYPRLDAYTAVANANSKLDGATLDMLIKQGLKELSVG